MVLNRYEEVMVLLDNQEATADLLTQRLGLVLAVESEQPFGDEKCAEDAPTKLLELFDTISRRIKMNNHLLSEIHERLRL